MKTLDGIRDSLKLCRNTGNAGCIELIEYRDKANVDGASHPVLFQVVEHAKIMVIGAVPGSIDASPDKVAYQKLVNGQFSLGHKSAQGLGEIMMRVGNTGNIELPEDIICLPTTIEAQDSHLFARERLGIHVTNLVKCHARRGWEDSSTPNWLKAACSCERSHLAYEIETIDPSMVILLGKRVADYFSESESWGLEGTRISDWAERADSLRFYGKNRFITAWIHPGGPYFWIQGREYWDLYAEQMSGFAS